MRITKYPQSCFLIEYKNKKILADPGTYVYEQTDLTPESWQKIDILLLTHEHSDHCLPAAISTIVENNPEMKIFSNEAVCDILGESDIKCEIIKEGEKKMVGGIAVSGVKAEHGPLPSGNPAPSVIGFLIDDKIYNTGDCIYLEEKPKTDIILVPIGGTVTMDLEEAIRFVKDIGYKVAIPMHYSNPKYYNDPREFAKSLENTDIKVKVLEDGESVEL